jgi:hypothetical protein
MTIQDFVEETGIEVSSVDTSSTIVFEEKENDNRSNDKSCISEL